jgi:biopolymer transport protein ExbB/TolQ
VRRAGLLTPMRIAPYASARAVPLQGSTVEGFSRSNRLIHVLMLLIIAIGVQAVYMTYVRPGAAAWTAEQEAIAAGNPKYHPPRSLLVIIHEPEPEAAIIMALWAFAMAVHQGLFIRRCREFFATDILPLPPGQLILREETRGYERTLEAVPGQFRDSVLVRALRAGLKRFGATGNVQDVSTTLHHVCESEAVRLDSELSLIRFAVWCIPAIGFVGTVRGLGEALQTAKFAFVAGDPSAVTAGLGVSFNSTFVALTLTIFVMFALHELQVAHDSLTLDAELFAEEKLVAKLKAEDAA